VFEYISGGNVDGSLPASKSGSLGQLVDIGHRMWALRRTEWWAELGWPDPEKAGGHEGRVCLICSYGQQ
jgi:hypothetical protein